MNDVEVGIEEALAVDLAVVAMDRMETRIPIETNLVGRYWDEQLGRSEPRRLAKEPIATTDNEADERAHNL